jgi:Arc/MetJ family transcription regulator
VYDIAILYTPEAFMRTNIVIDDSLMNQALKVSGYKTKKETVEEGLKLLIAQRNQLKIRDLRGKLNWEGDLDQMRTAK